MTRGGDDTTLRVPDGVPDVGPAVSDESLAYESFERHAVVGTGGNAVVHAATVGEDGQRVALKEPAATVVDDRTADRFAAEARTWASLDGHENVVGVVDWGTDPQPWLALEYMDGGTLADRLVSASVEQGLWVGVRLAEALRHAHRHGVAHLDVKPSNVLFRECEAGVWDLPKLTDWGVSAVLLEDEPGVEGVTSGYAAPEQFAPEQYGRPDDRTDVYQLGVVLYELLTGERPFEGPPGRAGDARFEGPPPRPTSRDGTLPPAVDAVLERALAPRKEDRYAAVVDLRRDLESLLADRCAYTPIDDGPALDGRSGDGTHGTDRSVPTAAGDTSVPRSTAELDAQGFVELSEAFFDDRDPASPARAVRTGFSLADVRAGYAIERTVERDGERVELTPRLRDRLADGADQAVVGPPDAGKSTLCKRVACAWLDADLGPVCYREDGTTTTFDRPSALGRWVRVAGEEGHCLVVVEDAVGEGSEAVFEAMRRFEGRDDVTFLLEATEDAWRSPDAVGMDARLDGYRRGEVETVHLPRPDEYECERLVERVVDLVDEPVAADPERLVADLTQGTSADASEVGSDAGSTAGRDERDEAPDSLEPGTLQLLLHRLAERVDPAGSEASAAPTTFAESVQRAYAELRSAAADKERVLDVALAANLCNAADLEVRPELLHAAALGPGPVERDEGRPSVGHADPVGRAYDVLTDRLLFDPDDEARPGEPTRRFRTAHAAWSVAFLAHAVERAGERSAHERFGRVLSALLALADDPARREAVDWRLHGEAPYLDRVTADPEAWVRRLLAATFELGERRPKLAPLFGTTEYSRVSLPACCPTETSVRRAYWRGRAYELAGRYDRAETEFRAYERLAEERTGDLDQATVAAARARARLHRGRVARMRGDYDRAAGHLEDALERYETQGDERGVAAACRNLGTVAWKRGELEVAETHLERSLDRYEAVGDEHGRGRAWSELGTVAWLQDRTAESGQRYRRALDVYREIADRRDEAICLNNLGIVAKARDELALAERRHRRGIECARAVGAERAEALNLTQLGRVLRRRGELTAAVEYQQAAYDIYERLGNRDHAANALLNLGVTEQVRGRFGTAREYTERALELKQELGDTSGRAHCLRNLAHMLQQDGRLEDAADRARQAVESARAAEDRSEEAACLVRLGAVEARHDETKGALATLGSGLNLAVDTGCDGVRARALTEFGRVATKRGAFVAAKRHLRAALEIRRQESEADDREEAAVRYELGRLNRRCGDTSQALTCFERAVDLAAATGATHRAALAAEAAAAVAEARGDEAAERAWHERAARFTGDP
jgi:tetratricopeptide (TPR) repeat protein